MIPYDDLVAALATWRARQGLPVARAAVTAPPPPRAAAPAAAPSSARTAPHVASARAVTPQGADLDDFGDDSALIEDPAYDPAGDDYVLPLGDAGVEQIGEPTAIGAAPDRTEGLLTPKRGKRNDW